MEGNVHSEYISPSLFKRDAVRIKVKYEVNGVTDWKSMAVDPDITSFASLCCLLRKAFDLNGNFEVSYLLPKSEESMKRADVFLSLASDWDLDAAFHSAATPFLTLKVDPILKQDVEEWDMLERAEAPPVQDIKSSTMQLPLSVSLRHEVVKTFFRVKEALVEVRKVQALKEPEWINSFDPLGRIIDPEELRIRVFCGGIEPSLRKEVWPHILGVFPPDLNHDERTRFLLMKTQVYHHLKQAWLERAPGDVEDVIHMVQKDVLRTDRCHTFFDVPEDHPNIVSLFNILTTYALSNPDVSYCQGMSDLASPLLVVLGDETLAYVCFCSLMQRMKANFLPSGRAMKKHFSQIGHLLRRTDEELYAYLEQIEAENMFFCYRMILLDLKREFPFSDALRVLETVWTSYPLEADNEESISSFYYKLFYAHYPHNTGRASPHQEGLFIANQSCVSNDEPLPHPSYLGNGCPFSLFLCLAILLNHREPIVKQQMDCNSLGMYFDKLIRKHDVNRVLMRSKSLYMEYIKAYLDGQTISPDTETAQQSGPHGSPSQGAQC